MGEVYRAFDSRLGREVAVKLLPPRFASDPDRLRRFEHEVRLAGQISHPNVVVVHDTGVHDGAPFIVMELLDGCTLRKRISSARLSPEVALHYGVQLAEGLAAAHERGVVHRDLKPENVMVLADDRVKLLDFGLAKLAQPPRDLAPVEPEAITESLTEPGRAVGTPAYMAPEQIRGEPVDARTDLFSLGLVLYEMFAGVPAFRGSAREEVHHAILAQEPVSLCALRPEIPASLAGVVHRCLAKDRARRFQSASDLAYVLRNPPAWSSFAPIPDPAGARRRRTLVRAVAAAALVALAALGYFGWPSARTRGELVRFTVRLPDGQILPGFAQAAISPRGREVAFAAVDSSGTGRLWVRELAALKPRVLEGTEGAFYPFWSPDSRSIGFFSRGQLKKVPASGGPVEIICPARAGRGASWSRRNRILFAPAPEGPLFVVPAEGGVPVAATTLDSAGGEVAQRWPCFLPDGRRFLFMSLPGRGGSFGTYAGDLAGGRRKLILSSSGAATYAAPGYLLSLRGQVLTAQRFDGRELRLVEEPWPVAAAPRVLGALGEPNVTSSADGTLVYVSATMMQTRLAWVDPGGGEPLDVALEPGAYLAPRLSPAGDRVAIELAESGTESDIWTIDLARRVKSRLTSGGALNRFPQWAPDASRVAFASNRGGMYNLYVGATGGRTAETALSATAPSLLEWPTDWSPDGKLIVYERYDLTTGYDIMLASPESDAASRPFRRTPFAEFAGRVSPDGRWLTYLSDETGRSEVCIEEFPQGGRRHQLSNGGGELPRWAPDGRSVLYLAPNGRLMSVAVALGDSLQPSAPELRRQLRSLRDFDVARDGRILGLFPASDATPPSELSVLLNWTKAGSP